jgi:arabinan endo-1,5-alpha-L-arabinosidase
MIHLNYNIVKRYSAEQVSADLQTSVAIKLNAGGTITGVLTGTWTFTAPSLYLALSDGSTAKVKVERERDWDNKIATTLIFTGLDNHGTAVWDKKK